VGAVGVVASALITIGCSSTAPFDSTLAKRLEAKLDSP
jgi:hypothetical protein